MHLMYTVPVYGCMPQMAIAIYTKFLDITKQSAHQSVFSVQMKNCEPFVFGPLLAIDSVPVMQLHTTLEDIRDSVT